MLKYFIEIKNRSFLLVLNCFFTVFITYAYKDILLFTIVQPSHIIVNIDLNTFYFIFTDATEIFSVYIKLISFFCFQIIFYFLFYHALIFFSFALFKKEYLIFKFSYKALLFINLISLFIASNLLIPLTWDFFLSFQNLILKNNSLKIHFEAKIAEYFMFYTYFYYACIFYFQFVTFFFLLFSYINLDSIKKFRKLYHFCFIIFSTLISPDVFNQFLVSIFFIIKYEFFVFSKKLKNILLIKVKNSN
jgi:sec-independent protein translocase protein TatC